MEPYAPYRQVFLTWARPPILYSFGTSVCPSRVMLGQHLADEGGCYTRPAPPQPLAEEGKEEVPEKEEGEEEVLEEEEGYKRSGRAK